MWHPNSWVVSFTLNPHCIRENVQSAAWRCDLMVQVLQVFTALDTSRGVGSRWGGKERRLGVVTETPMRPPGWAESGLHVWNWKYPEASLHVRIQGVQCCLSSFPRNEKKVTSSMFHHYNHALTPILNPFAHLLLHYTPWVTLGTSGIQLLDHLAPALTLTL